jgi:hypothetical protein
MNETYRLGWKKLLNRFRGRPMEEFDCLCVDQIIEQYKAVPKEHITEEVKGVMDELREHQRNKCITVSDHYAAENVLITVIPIEQLRRAAWNLRERFRHLAGEASYNQYMRSNPPDTKTAPENELRADLIQLLSSMQRLDMFRKIIEKARYAIAGRLGFLTFVIFLIVMLVLLIKTRFIGLSDKFVITPIMFVGAAGAIGGCMATLQRILSTPIKDESVDLVFEFQKSYVSWLFLPPINGILFATVLFLMFASNLITGELFPAITLTLSDQVPDKVPATLTNDALSLKFLKETHPEEVTDYAKLIIWSFVAGYFQWFVPDALSRLTTQAKKNSETRTQGPK